MLYEVITSSCAASLAGIELNPELAERACRNVLLNLLQDRVQILQGDVRDIRKLLSAQSCQVVLSNPPYREVGTGRVAPREERAAARHRITSYNVCYTKLLRNPCGFASRGVRSAK